MKLRWIDNINDDITSLGLRGHVDLTNDQVQWIAFIRNHCHQWLAPGTDDDEEGGGG